MKKILLALITLFVATFSYAETTTDTEAVKKASMNYIEGFYEGNTDKLKSCLIPTMRKHGFWKKKGSGKFQNAGSMSFEQALAYAAGVKKSGKFPKADAPKKIEVLEVLDKIAVSKVTAWWGRDYLLLAKNDGKWMIRQILWEGPEKTANPPDADRVGAKAVGMDYLTGFYEGVDSKLKNVFKPTMYKYGYSFNRKTKVYKTGKQMTYAKAFEFAKDVREGKWKPKPGSIKKVDVLDVMNHIAAIKVTAVWGIDYMLLSKTDGKWMIDHVLWSSVPQQK